MGKVFEDYFSEFQADMVSICLNYVENRADKIYIYCSNEGDVISSGFFYEINGKVVDRHKVNDALDKKNANMNFVYDVSTDRQGKVLKIINDDIKNISDLCKEYSREVPTEMKIVYDVSKNSLIANYRYDLVYSNDPIKIAGDVEGEWFEEIKLKYSRL